SLGTAEVRMTRIGFAVKPGVPRSTMKQEIPARPLALSVRAQTRPHGASWAREAKTLRPFSTQRPPRFSARVWIAPAGSDPPDGSVMAKNVLRPSRVGRTAEGSVFLLVPAPVAGGRW